MAVFVPPSGGKQLTVSGNLSHSMSHSTFSFPKSTSTRHSLIESQFHLLFLFVTLVTVDHGIALSLTVDILLTN